MAASKSIDIMTDAFLDAVTGAALFGKVRLPGSPTVFYDEDVMKPSEEEIAMVVRQLEAAVQAREVSGSQATHRVAWKWADVFVLLSLFIASVYLLAGSTVEKLIGISTGLAYVLVLRKSVLSFLNGTASRRRQH
jgi:hypothetical protein